MNAISNAIEEALRTRRGNSTRLREFLDSSQDGRRYLIGRNGDAAEVMKRVRFSGVIDDGPKAPTSWMNTPVVHMADVNRKGYVLNCSTSVAPVTVLDNLRTHGLENIINLHELLEIAEFGTMPLPWFVRQQREDIAQHQQHWSRLYDCLEDAQSCKTLLDVLRYRLSADADYMQGYSVRLNEQYFETFLRLKGETFVDAGGFDGDSTEIFCQHDPAYQEVFFFEPSPQNMLEAQSRLKGLRNIHWMPLGLSDRSGFLAFDPKAGSASAVQTSGDHTIKVERLDDCLNKPVSFIKMDLEGWELHALDGCEQQIRNNQPKLALAVYHHAAHFWEVWEKIMAWHPGYKVRLRHYTQGWSETVMYFSND